MFLLPSSTWAQSPSHMGSKARHQKQLDECQSTDPLAAEVGAFFARIKVPIDFVPGAEASVSKAAPRTLYCAFIQHVRERLAQAQSLRDANRWLTEWSSRESQRMEASANDHWKAAIELRRQLGAIEAIARE